jgi:hypothetical protein
MSLILIKGKVYCAVAGHPIYIQSGAPGEVAAHCRQYFTNTAWKPEIL